ncbi:TrmB family transcriptional regulator [Yersinia enterocolitica]|uniref:TrmB family transcriptional regulator n=1 Tax=Yersinia enterocolitica TaxID=630 RepID=UPI001C8DC577|nr:TrmB family transcriptional regulator [Yersinia enterocolitica]MBX9476491.1 TrmB family transcriptional regulator [Yersinia enterocolitica]
MLNQNDMTKDASVVLACLTRLNWWSAGHLAELISMSEARCQFILTQLAMAGLVEEDREVNKFRRC